MLGLVALKRGTDLLNTRFAVERRLAKLSQELDRPIEIIQEIAVMQQKAGPLLEQCGYDVSNKPLFRDAAGS